MKYDLTRLGEHEFEHMSQALAIGVLGTGVNVFGAGPDGGREATFDGQLKYPDPAPNGPWNGYGVLQAKFREGYCTTAVGTRWLLNEIRKEFRPWVDPSSGRRERGRRMPQYIIFTTNVVLSPDPGRGGIDTANDLIDEINTKNDLGLKGWAVWHHDQICRYLDVHDSIRRTYSGMTVVGDVLADMQRALDRLRPDQKPNQDFSDLLTGQVAKGLHGQQWVRLGQAGDTANQKLRLSDVAVDLPATVHGPRDRDKQGQAHRVAGVVEHIIRAGNTTRRKRPAAPELPHLVIVGGPGQGKTTLGQWLCQVYRVALLQERPEHTLGPEVPELLRHYQAHQQRLQLSTPVCRRWPLRIELSKFADRLAEAPSTTLLDYAAEQVRRAGPINPLMLQEWLREWPWIVVLDGLDEVADADVRETMLRAISDFYIDAAQVDADLLVVGTTRPQGYRDEFSPAFYEHLALQTLDTKDALSYAKHLASINYADDPELHDDVLNRLTTAAKEPATARLMRTPLQVTIMTLLLERRPRVPGDRHGLFEAYYNTLYDREIAKHTQMSRFLDEQRRNVDYLHERVGLLLQIRSEHAGDAEAHLAQHELRELAVRRLRDEGYAPNTASEMAGTLADAATDRVVLLVGFPNGNVGFEVRSLQELMAARAIFAGGEEQLLAALGDLAHSAHWRNTWLFAASRLFAQRESLRDRLLLMLDILDTKDPSSLFTLPGARLAVDMLDEDVSIGQPLYTGHLVQRALRLLDTYPGAAMTRLATVVDAAASSNANLIRQAVAEIDSKISQRGRTAVTALDALAAWAGLPGDTAITARSRVDGFKRSTPAELTSLIEQLNQLGHRDTWLPYPDAERDTAVKSGPKVLLAHLMARDERDKQLEGVVRQLEQGGSHPAELDDPELRDELVRAIEELPVDHWPQAADLHQRLVHWESRRPANSAAVSEILA